MSILDKLGKRSKQPLVLDALRMALIMEKDFTLRDVRKVWAAMKKYIEHAEKYEAVK